MKVKTNKTAYFIYLVPRIKWYKTSLGISWIIFGINGPNQIELSFLFFVLHFGWRQKDIGD